mmetsp:Transcript_19356/g.48576  ORF Transcript_19356/g.48576 Transcript_19356/m.48576 type:complete len:244 (-) Transcript_19356:261-992(-)
MLNLSSASRRLITCSVISSRALPTSPSDPQSCTCGSGSGENWILAPDFSSRERTLEPLTPISLPTSRIEGGLSSAGTRSLRSTVVALPALPLSPALDSTTACSAEALMTSSTPFKLAGTPCTKTLTSPSSLTSNSPSRLPPSRSTLRQTPVSVSIWERAEARSASSTSAASRDTPTDVLHSSDVSNTSMLSSAFSRACFEPRMLTLGSSARDTMIRAPVSFSTTLTVDPPGPITSLAFSLFRG